MNSTTQGPMANVSFFKEQLSPIWFNICPDTQKFQNDIFTTNVTLSKVTKVLTDCFRQNEGRIADIYEQTTYYSRLILSVLGLLGCILILITLIRTKSVYFQSPTFRYFRLLIALQFIIILNTTVFRDSVRLPIQWLFVNVYIMPFLIDGFTNWSSFIIFYLSIERAVACLLPAHFHKLNGKKFFFILSTLTFLMSVSAELPIASKFRLKTSDPNHTDDWTKFYYTVTDDTRIFSSIDIIESSVLSVGQFSALVTATVAAIYGFYVAYKRKVRLLQKTSNSQQQQQQLLNEWKVTRQLCILQLAQAVPTILFNLSNVIDSNPTLEPIFTIYRNITYASDEQVSKAITSYHIFCFVQDLTSITGFFGHCMHFYMYFICSRPFRAAVWEALRCAKVVHWLKKAASKTTTTATNLIRVNPAPVQNRVDGNGNGSNQIAQGGSNITIALVNVQQP